QHIDRVIQPVVNSRYTDIGFTPFKYFIDREFYAVNRCAGAFIHQRVGIDVDLVYPERFADGYCMTGAGLRAFGGHYGDIAQLLHFFNKYLDSLGGDAIVINDQDGWFLFCHAPKLTRKALPDIAGNAFLVNRVRSATDCLTSRPLDHGLCLSFFEYGQSVHLPCLLHITSRHLLIRQIAVSPFLSTRSSALLILSYS